VATYPGLRRYVTWRPQAFAGFYSLERRYSDFFDAECITVEALRRYDLVLPTVSQRVSTEIEHMLSLLMLEPTSSLRSSSYGFIREMLHGTDLISVMPRLMMAGDLLRGTLKLVPLPVDVPPRPAGLILPGNRSGSAASQAFVAALEAHVSELKGITGGNMSS